MGIGVYELEILCVAKTVWRTDYMTKGILISPMYIYIKKCGGLWGVGGVSLRNLCELVGSKTVYSDNI